MHPIVFLPVFVVLIIVISNCLHPAGSIVIAEEPDGTAFTADLQKWSSSKKCELSLHEGDVLQVEVACEEGEIALEITGKNGSNPYLGKALKSTVFTVTASETDKYEIRISGKNAAGKLAVKNVGS